MFKSAPGKEGATLVPDLAESLGKPSDDSKTWTYTLRQGVKFEDGTPVTSKDVKYAVERSLDKTTFPNGPTYFNDFLDLQGYTSPYADSDPNKLGLKAIETPDDRTIVFHLKQPFSGFDYFAQMPSTAPVPVAKDTGSKYKEHVVSTGPYMFETNELGKSFTLVRNPNWDQATDPNRKPLPDRIEVALNVNADDIDNRLQSGDLDVAIEGTGVGPSAQGKILADQTLKANTDSALNARLWYTALNPDVAPLDNIHCRKAVEYATDKTGYQRAYGGSTGGDIATQPAAAGDRRCAAVRPYATPGNAGDVAKAKDELAQCGQPNGFTTGVSYRAERPKEKATAEALQQSLREGRHQAGDQALPADRLLQALRRQAGLREGQRPRPDRLRLGRRLARRLRLPRADRRQPGDPRYRRQHQPRRQGPRGRRDARQGGDRPPTPPRARSMWVDIDRKVMEDAYIVPGVWAKGLLYRPPNLTNVFITDGYQMYDYLALGTTRK